MLAEEYANLEVSNIGKELLVYEGVFNDELYADYSIGVGKIQSRKEREERNLTDSSLTYGEVLFEPFAMLLNKVREFGGIGEVSKKGEDEMKKDDELEEEEEEEEEDQRMGRDPLKFVDIGTGTGRPVFIAALSQPFTEVVGIEILDGLFHICDQVCIIC